MNTEGLTRFVESASIPHRMIKRAEDKVLVESLREAQAKVGSIYKLTENIEDSNKEGYWVPISFYNKINGNRRNYNKRLWENVINNQRDTFIGAPMLSDHPSGDSDGNPKDICGVWLDCKLGEQEPDGSGLVYGLLVPSGTLGKDLKDHLANGLRIGTSSSGFGKLMSDGVTVDPDTFQIERLADWVLNPSQGTFFAYDESDDNIEDRSIHVHESVDNNENNTILNSNMIKENVVKDSTSKLTRLEEKKFRRDMESFLESAAKNEDPQARLEEFKEIKGWLEDGACPDLKEKVEAKIQEAEEYIRTALTEKTEYASEFEVESPKDLKEKLTKLAQDTSLLKKESIEWKDISEKLQEKYDQLKGELSTRPTAQYALYLKEQVAKTQQLLDERTEKMKQVVSDLVEAYEKVQDVNKKYEEANQGLLAENSKLTEQLAEAENSRADGTKFNEALEHSTYEISKRLKEANDKIAAYKKIIESQRAQLEAYSIKENNAKKVVEAKKAENSRLQGKLHESQQRSYKLAETIKNEHRVQAESTVSTYYNKLYETYGNDIKPFEKRILACRTLVEAKQYFFKNVLQQMNESREIDSTRIPETLELTPEARIKALNEKNFKKTSMFDRMPKGWI